MLTNLLSNCPFCLGSNLKRFLVNAHDAPSATVSIIECRQCEAAWQWPRGRTTNESTCIFDQAYIEKGEGTYFDPEKRLSVAQCHTDFVRSTIKISNARLLDIGCGDGIFARQIASTGWSVIGVDPAIPEDIPQFPHENLCLVRAYSASTAEFDVVTLFDVIEHVEDPVDFLAYAISFLKPGGYLVVETGNYQSDGRILGGNSWWNFQLDHRWYFAPPQLRIISEQLGMKNIVFADRVLRPWWRPNIRNQSSTFLTTTKSLIKHPLQAKDILLKEKMLKHAQDSWSEWHHLEIMTMTAIKQEST